MKKLFCVWFWFAAAAVADDPRISPADILNAAGLFGGKVAPGEVIVLFPANAGLWHLQADESGTAICDPVDKAADKYAGLSLGITELGAAFFGGTRLGALAAAGRVSQQSAGALARLSAALSWDPAPWCPVIF